MTSLRAFTVQKKIKKSTATEVIRLENANHDKQRLFQSLADKGLDCHNRTNLHVALSRVMHTRPVAVDVQKLKNEDEFRDTLHGRNTVKKKNKLLDFRSRLFLGNWFLRNYFSNFFVFVYH